MRRARGSFFLGSAALITLAVAAPGTALAKRPAEREDPYEELDRTSPRSRIDKTKPARPAPPGRAEERERDECVCAEPSAGAVRGARDEEEEDEEDVDEESIRGDHEEDEEDEEDVDEESVRGDRDDEEDDDEPAVVVNPHPEMDELSICEDWGIDLDELLADDEEDEEDVDTEDEDDGGVDEDDSNDPGCDDD